jgi:threonine dehydratase
MIEELSAASHAAATLILPFVRLTPVELLSPPGSADQLWAKCENFQTTGSFKVRGAINKLLTLDPAARERGVVTASTGNHGAAVAYGCFQLGIDATVFVPETADPSKVAAIERWGAAIEAVPGDPLMAEMSARRRADEVAGTYVPPYNDAAVVAGQGTVGVELLEQIPRIDTLVVAVGGGGLISGTAAVVKHAHPAARVLGASPENSNVMMRSIEAGRVIEAVSTPTLSDGTFGGVEAGSLTFELCRDLVDGWMAIPEDEIATELRRHVADHHQLIEGSAALALAAARRLPPMGVTVLILCGANIAPATLQTVLAGGGS